MTTRATPGRAWLVALLTGLAATLAAGCGDDAPAGPGPAADVPVADGGGDAGGTEDAAAETVSDAAPDSATDVAPDSVTDAAAETVSDAAPDSVTDAVSDEGPDAAADTDGGPLALSAGPGGLTAGGGLAVSASYSLRGAVTVPASHGALASASYRLVGTIAPGAVSGAAP